MLCFVSALVVLVIADLLGKPLRSNRHFHKLHIRRLHARLAGSQSIESTLELAIPSVHMH